MANRIRTCLMFERGAEEAMEFYVGLFPDSEIVDLKRYADGERAGEMMRGEFRLNGVELICINSPARHEFGFTPAMSIFVDCASGAEQRDLFDALSQDGKVLMPLDNYGFSRQFTWLEDRHGVSWQLNLP
jgi:predicted 3-demethylubiquinone-9 3-methyltransferase (glyoxalase superfamily)